MRVKSVMSFSEAMEANDCDIYTALSSSDMMLTSELMPRMYQYCDIMVLAIEWIVPIAALSRSMAASKSPSL